jgi:hypothetical protein
VGTVVDVPLPLDPSSYAEAGDPEPVVARMEVLEIADHVPDRVRIELLEHEDRLENRTADRTADRADERADTREGGGSTDDPVGASGQGEDR